jgi:hypothetical protein
LQEEAAPIGEFRCLLVRFGFSGANLGVGEGHGRTAGRWMEIHHTNKPRRNLPTLIPTKSRIRQEKLTRQEMAFHEKTNKII